MTLQDCIDRFNARQPAPITDRVTTLSPAGNAAVALIRALRTLHALTPPERAQVLDHFRDEMAELLDGQAVAVLA